MLKWLSLPCCRLERKGSNLRSPPPRMSKKRLSLPDMLKLATRPDSLHSSTALSSSESVKFQNLTRCHSPSQSHETVLLTSSPQWKMTVPLTSSPAMENNVFFVVEPDPERLRVQNYLLCGAGSKI